LQHVIYYETGIETECLDKEIYEKQAEKVKKKKSCVECEEEKPENTCEGVTWYKIKFRD
jgi:hypothetical protein